MYKKPSGSYTGTLLGLIRDAVPRAVLAFLLDIPSLYTKKEHTSEYTRIVTTRVTLLVVAHVCAAIGRWLSTAQEVSALHHEVSVTSNVAVVVHPRHDFLEEAVDLVVRASATKLRDIHWLAVRQFDRLLHMRLEVVDVLSTVIPVNVEAVDLAVRAG